MNRAKLGRFLFYLYCIYFSTELDLFLFLELVIASRCQLWGLDICKVGYIGYEYTMIESIFGIE